MIFGPVPNPTEDLHSQRPKTTTSNSVGTRPSPSQSNLLLPLIKYVHSTTRLKSGMSDSIAPPGEQEARAFTVISTNALGQPHVLPPQACNPAMDLAVLLCEPSDEQTESSRSGGGSFSKGKAKASAGFTTQVSLWRLSGAKVWEVEVTGRVLGLTWSMDGEHSAWRVRSAC